MFIPPDPDNHSEMRWVIAFVGAVARADPWILILLFMALVIYAIGRLCYEAVVKFVDLCKERIEASGRYALAFRLILASCAVVGFMGLGLALGETTHTFGLGVLAWDFAAVTGVTAALGWYVEEKMRKEEWPELDGVKLSDIVAWQNQINTAHDAARAKGS